MNIEISNIETAKKMFPKYNTRVIKFIGNVMDSIIEQYGKIPSAFNVTLSLLADQLELYVKSYNALQKLSPDFSDDNGTFRMQRQLFNIQETALEKANKILSNFSIAPLLKTKINKLSKSDTSSQSSTELLETLLS